MFKCEIYMFRNWGEKLCEKIHNGSLGQIFWRNGFNTASDKLIRVCGTEISSKEVHKSDGLVWCSHFWNFFEDILAPLSRINLSFAVLDLCYQTGSFAYKKTNNLKTTKCYGAWFFKKLFF
jgi:hypothetical protein